MLKRKVDFPLPVLPTTARSSPFLIPIEIFFNVGWILSSSPERSLLSSSFLHEISF
jgi:hypothetical protein